MYCEASYTSCHLVWYRSMMDVLRDKEHLEYFRLFLAQRRETSVDAPLEFWLAVEDLKASVHQSKKYETKRKRIVDRFLKGDTSKGEVTFWAISYNLNILN